MKSMPGFVPGTVFGIALGLLAAACVIQYFNEEIFSKYPPGFR